MQRCIGIFVLAFLIAGALAGRIALADGPTSTKGGLSLNKPDPKVSPLLQAAVGKRQPYIQEPLDEPGRVTRRATRFLTVDSQHQTPKNPRSVELPELAKSEVKDDSSRFDPPDEPARFDTAGRVQVYVYAVTLGEGELTALKDQGLEVEVFNQNNGIVQGWLPIDNITAVAGLKFVRRISPPDYAIPHSGSVKSQGDLISRSGVLRGMSGLTGAGVMVGEISDGVDSRAGAQGSGDLPATLDIDPDLTGEGDEGTALLEIVHDIAPGARLAFSGPSTSLEMVESIQYLATEAFGGSGVDIIVDDLGFLGEPYFADGMVAEAAQEAVDAGVVFASSAGNDGRSYYQGDYTAGNVGREGMGSYHAFATDDERLAVTVREGALVFLQWNDEYGSSSNDYDLNNGLCLASIGPQDGDDDPIEGLRIAVASTTLDPRSISMDVIIHAYSVQAAPAGRLKLLVAGGLVDEYGTAQGSIYGHPAVRGVIAVGAIDAGDPENDTIERFSSQGPVQIYYPTIESRRKPDVVSIDGVDITGAGGFSNPFFGTSASSPHVAGIAALALEADRRAHPGSHRHAAAKRVAANIRDTAVDLGDLGFDDVYGAGRADALVAVTAIGLLSDVTLTVDSTGDGADNDTTDGACDDGNGACTLRAAIEESNEAGGAIINFNIAGSTPHTIQPASALPDISGSVIIDGTSQAPSSDCSTGASVRIEIDGTNAGSGVDGLTFTGSGGEVRGLAINRFESDGIVLRGAAAVAVEDNLIGTDNTGETDQGNGGSGISVTTAGNFITRNVISGNGAHGVNVSGSSASRTYISGNYIGTNGDGETGLGNDDSGVSVTGAPDVQTAENVISGNGRHGVNVSAADAAVVLDNLIGSDATGAVDLGNGASGIAIASASNAFVAGNVISGNGTQGVKITGATGSAENILAFNSIINNGGHGVQLTGAGVTATILRFNVIGTDADGDADLGNGGSGVHVGQNASSNLVDENFIAFSGGDGVTIISPGATGNTAWENAIFSNTGLGIDLGAGGVTANDATDADTGSNNLQNFPLLSAAARNETEIGVHGTLNGNADTEYIIDFYSNSACDGAGNGEGEVWLGFSRDATDATGSADITSFFPATELAGNFITATATAPDDSTSEFSACAEAATLPDLVLPEGVDVDEGDTVEYEVTLAEQPSADVTVYLQSSAGAVATATPASLPFTTANWETPQTVTVTGVQDDDANDDSAAISQVVVHEGDNYIAGVVGVAVADDDLPELTLSAGRVSITEGGSVDYTIQLAAQPTGDVAVSFSPTAGDVDSASLSSTTHTFTTSNWDTTHTITVGGAPDDDASNQVLLVNHTATIGGDERVLGGLFIIVVDDDLPELTLPQLPEVVAEGATSSYQAVLAAQPTADVTVTLTSTDPEAATTRPATVDFTTAEWNTAQTVTVEPVVDDDGSNEAVGILHTATIGGDDYFLGLRIVLVADSDTAPYFIDEATAVRSISEISTPGTDAGPPVTALDPDFGPGSYGLSGDDASPFKIDSVNGQISLADGVALDYENPIDSDGGNDYEVTVTVTRLRRRDRLHCRYHIGARRPRVVSWRTFALHQQHTAGCAHRSNSRRGGP